MSHGRLDEAPKVDKFPVRYAVFQLLAGQRPDDIISVVRVR